MVRLGTPGGFRCVAGDVKVHQAVPLGRASCGLGLEPDTLGVSKEARHILTAFPFSVAEVPPRGAVLG